jgi:hypothetical protein
MHIDHLIDFQLLFDYFFQDVIPFPVLAIPDLAEQELMDRSCMFSGRII